MILKVRKYRLSITITDEVETCAVSVNAGHSVTVGHSRLAHA
jgi:hypothetical protein